MKPLSLLVEYSLGVDGVDSIDAEADEESDL